MVLEFLEECTDDVAESWFIEFACGFEALLHQAEGFLVEEGTVFFVEPNREGVLVASHGTRASWAWLGVGAVVGWS